MTKYYVRCHIRIIAEKITSGLHSYFSCSRSAAPKQLSVSMYLGCTSEVCTSYHMKMSRGLFINAIVLKGGVIM